MIILESTVKPETCEKEIYSVVKDMGIDADIVYCPERAFPGNTLHEIVNNDRIIGGITPKAADIEKKDIFFFCKR